MSRTLLVFALVLVAVPAYAQKAPAPALASEYDPYSQAWNGMASFVGLAEGMGFSVDVRETLQWDELTSKDILFLVFPLQRVDPAKLAAFVQAGGNVVIADDFGDGKEAMQALGLLRIEVEQARSSRFYEGRMYAPIANAREFMFTTLTDSFTHVDAILAADREATQGRTLYDDGYFAKMFERTGPIMEKRMSAAMTGVASMITQAWTDAGKPALPLDAPPRSPRPIRR